MSSLGRCCRPCTTLSIRNRSLQQWRRKLSFIAPIMQVVTREQFHNEVEHTPRRKVRCATEDDVRQDAVIVQGIPSAQVGERIQEQIAETISRETVQQRTDEQIMAVAAPGAATVSPAPPMSMIGHAMLTPVDVYTKTAPVIEPMVAPVIEHIAPSISCSILSFGFFLGYSKSSGCQANPGEACSSTYR